MKYTGNYGLKKPDGTDVVNIDDLNGNADILDKELTNKVDKVNGKGLSTRDYTDTEKSKLAGIQDGAQKNKVTSVNNKTGAVTVTKADIGLGNVTNDRQATKVDLDEHKAEKVQHLSYATASGTNTYNTTIGGISSLIEGMSIKIKFTNANTSASTLNINSLGAKSIRKSNGDTLSSGNIKAGQICHLVYTGSVFQLLGEGGEYGTAQIGDVLNGKTIGTEDGVKTGVMPNNGAINNTITTQNGQVTVPKGYHNGSGIVKANFANLVAGNIKKDVNVGGVVGNYEGNPELMTQYTPGDAGELTIEPPSTQCHDTISNDGILMKMEGEISYRLLGHSKEKPDRYSCEIHILQNDISKDFVQVESDNNSYPDIKAGYLSVKKGDILKAAIKNVDTSAGYQYGNLKISWGYTPQISPVIVK